MESLSIANSPVLGSLGYPFVYNRNIFWGGSVFTSFSASTYLYICIYLYGKDIFGL